MTCALKNFKHCSKIKLCSEPLIKAWPVLAVLHFNLKFVHSKTFMLMNNYGPGLKSYELGGCGSKP